MSENLGTIEEPTIGYDFERLYSIDEATVDFHVSKSQISRDSNSKRLAYLLNDRCKKRYKAADLYHLYGFRKPKEPDDMERSEPEETSNILLELAVLKEKLRSKDDALKAKDEVLKRFEEEVRDLRQHRDKLTENNNRLTLLLSAPKEPAPEPSFNWQKELPEPKKSFWQKLFS